MPPGGKKGGVDLVQQGSSSSHPATALCMPPGPATESIDLVQQGDFRAGQDQFRSRSGHPTQWRSINRGSLSAVPRWGGAEYLQLCRYLLNLPPTRTHSDVLVAWSAPRTGERILSTLLHPPALLSLSEGQAMLDHYQ